MYMRTFSLLPGMTGREDVFELHWFHCMAEPIQKSGTHFNISSKKLNEGKQRQR